MILKGHWPSFTALRGYQGVIFKDMDIILRFSSALAQHELFLGYLHETPFWVYSKRELGYENVLCTVVDTFDGIEYEIIDGIKCTTVSRTFNDMMAAYLVPGTRMDFLALTDGLTRFWASNGDSFDGLVIDPANAAVFDMMKDWPRETYEDPFWDKCGKDLFIDKG
jgi:hypothetical protein